MIYARKQAWVLLAVGLYGVEQAYLILNLPLPDFVAVPFASSAKFLPGPISRAFEP